MTTFVSPLSAKRLHSRGAKQVGPTSRNLAERSPTCLARPLAAIRGFLVRHPDRAALLTILAVGLAVRLAFTFRTPIFLVHDSATYFESGYDLARGYGFGLAFKRTPLYPFFIAAVVDVVGEDMQGLAFVQHLLGLVTCSLTYLLGHALFGRPAGFIAGLLVALAGQLIIYEHYVLAEALFIPILLGFGLAFVAALKRPDRPFRWLVLAGVLLGLAGLTRPVGQAVLVAIPPTLLVAARSWRRAAVLSVVVALGFAAVVVPWMLRNYLQNGSFESAGALGQTLVGRITRHDEGFVIPSPDSPSPLTDPLKTEARALVLRQMARDARPSAINHRLRETYGWSEAEANRLMRDVCVDILLSQKDRYVVGTVVKWRKLLWGETEDFLGYHWATRKSGELRDDWVSNATIAHVLTPPTSQQEAEKGTAAAIAGFFSPAQPTVRWILVGLLAAGAAALYRSGQRPALVLILLLVLALTIPAAALVGYVPRYRYPADPFMAVVAGGGALYLVELARSVRPTLSRRLVPSPPVRAGDRTPAPSP